MCGGGGKGSSGGSGAFGGYAAGLPPAQQNFTQASPEAMGWYRNAMDSAQQAASQPYQRFGTQASDFVAQLNAQQQAAQQGLQGQAEATAPYAQMGAGMQAASGMGNAAQMAGAYMNPFMQQVVSPVQQALQQQQGQQLAQQQADAIRGGAFGGERSGLQRATLQGQQELAMGQALSPLYQTGYGQALGAAQTDLQRQLAAGQGLSQAGLAAQQASLGAGTLGQQTQQAGITALQNQFNTAQMFPYMQAQFLSGIAGGLGPLMGQTSTQTQAQNPFGMFLASGGVAEDHSRMGGAVRDGGDYERGGYVRGGVSYGDDIGLSSQEQMYKDMESAEKGTQMPTGEIHAAQGLKPAEFGALPKKKSTLDELKGIAGLAKTGLDIGKGLGLDKLFSSTDYNAPASDFVQQSAEGMASGLPAAYQDAASYMPAAAEAAGGSGILEGLGGALSGAATTAAEYLPLILAPIGLKDGGEVRPHYEDGGVSSDDPVWGRMLGQESGNKQFDRSGNPLTSPAGAIGIAQVMPGTAPEAAKLAGLPFDPVKYRTDKTYNETLGRAYYNQQLKKFGTPEKAAAAYNAGPGRLQQAISRAGEGGDYRSFLPAETQKYLSNVIGGAPIAKEGLRSAIAGLQEDRSKIPMGDPRRRFMATTVPQDPSPSIGPEKSQGLGDYLTSEKFVVPALTGLAEAGKGMLGSKSRYLGTALAEGALSGIGAGAKSYMDTQKQRADITKTAAEAQERMAQTGLLGTEAGLVGAETKEALGRAAKNAILTGPDGLPAGAIIFDADGKSHYMNFGELYANRDKIDLLPSDLKKIEDAAKVKGIATDAGDKAVETAKNIPATAAAPITEPKAPITAEPSEGKLKPLPVLFGLDPNEQKQVRQKVEKLTGTDVRGQEKFFGEQEQRSKAANTLKPLALELSTAFGSLPKTGPLAPGAAQPRVASLAEWANSLAQTFGLERPANPQDLSYLNQIKKITGQMKTQATSGAGQHALGAIEEFEQMFPSGKATREGIAANLASILMMNQKEQDKIHYFENWKNVAQEANPSLATASGALADTAFSEKYNKQYAREVKQIEKMFLTDVPGAKDPETGRPMNWFTYIQKHGDDLSPDEKALIEKKFGDGILRYFTSVQR